ncbi:uncharacterized protein DNG_07873 [Cephalotrichum gorgonifer]|uniref:Uncharacterized protein n=1 Tax=Cephalotrichum gorgonifer TaxID=2041049 RepID=A0AAE8N5G3_9PEZI|nr:uncharacterized protein DNG_07873 [Cephalotrichum gorgonifer]
MRALFKVNHREGTMQLLMLDKFDCATAFAWVIVPHEDDQDEQPDILQFCPWFLKYGMNQGFKFQDEFKPGVLATIISALSLDEFATWLMYTPVDLMEVFDKVIVHELAHTRRGHELLDVGGFGGYGWKNCRKLSTEREDPNIPSKNADTLALFASVSELIYQGGVIYEDGTFYRPPTVQAGGGNAATKRSAIVPDQIPHFNASSLKGRPLF